MRRAAWLWALVLAACASLLGIWPAQAQAPERVRELIYHVNAYQGSGWQGAFYPQSEDTLYLFAGQINTVAPRYTMVYFWPITQRYLADWAALDEAVEARLQVRQAGQVIETFDLQDYVLQDPAGAGDSLMLWLYTGEEAHARFEAYRAGLDAYWDAEAEYIEQQGEGQTAERPRPPDLFSTRVLQGFLVNLPPGVYQAALLDENNQVITGSQKRLEVIAPRRAGVGYEIIPESKWTVREQSSTPEQIIYVSGSTRLFFRPQREMEVNARAYDQLVDPQAPAGDAATWKRVPLADIVDVGLRYSAAGQEAPVDRRGYVVVQLNGSAFGYEIKPVEQTDGTAPPNFEAFEVNVTLEPGQSASLWLVDGEGRVIEGSQRTLRGVRPPAGQWVLLPALVPLALALEFARRRRQRRRAK